MRPFYTLCAKNPQILSMHAACLTATRREISAKAVAVDYFLFVILNSKRHKHLNTVVSVANVSMMKSTAHGIIKATRRDITSK
jgi:hypothetical protein